MSTASASQWPQLFHQLLPLAEGKQVNHPEALSLAKAWENFQSELSKDQDLQADYQQYYENNPQDTRDESVDLIDQQDWYSKLQVIELFVQDVLKRES